MNGRKKKSHFCKNIFHIGWKASKKFTKYVLFNTFLHLSCDNQSLWSVSRITDKEQKSCRRLSDSKDKRWWIHLWPHAESLRRQRAWGKTFSSSKFYDRSSLYYHHWCLFESPWYLPPMLTSPFTRVLCQPLDLEMDCVVTFEHSDPEGKRQTKSLSLAINGCASVYLLRAPLEVQWNSFAVDGGW